MKIKIIAIMLVIIGTLQLTGDLFGFPVLKTLGLVSHASPAPKVFTAQEGFETYSSDFYIKWIEIDRQEHITHLSPATYKNICGPYNRRNAYGAALSYAPVLYANPKTREMHASIIHYAFCGQAPLLHELGIDPLKILGNIQIEIKPRQKLPADHSWKLNYEIICNK